MEPIETITQAMKQKTSLKFQAWDEYGSTESGLPLLLDPTVFAYAMLKDKQNNPLKLLPWQDQVINDKNRFVVCVGANQIGKSLSGSIKILHHVLFVPNATVLVTAAKYDQAKKIITDIKDMCVRSSLNIKDFEEVDNKTTLSLRNYDDKGVSKVIAVAPTESGLGYDATLVYMDETGFMENGIKLYLQVFQPRTYFTKNLSNPDFTMGQILSISNPNAQQGLLWYQWNLPNYSKYRFNFLANPNNTIQEYEGAKKSMPSDVFDSTMAAVFSSESGRFITKYEYDLAVAKSKGFTMPMNRAIGIGLDLAGEDIIGRKNDMNVLYIGYTEKNDKNQDEVIICQRKTWKSGTPRAEIKAEVKRLFEIYPVTAICYDKPGVGDSFKNMLMESGIPEYKIHSLTYSLPNKSEVYYNIKILYEQGRITHPDIPELESQFSTLDFNKTASGHLQIHHKKEHLKDDECDGISNCAWSLTRANAVIVTAEWV